MADQGTRRSSDFRRVAAPRRSNRCRKAAAHAAAFHQWWVGQNRDTHTIKIRATDQRHTARLTAGKTQGYHAHFCSIPKGKRCHPVSRRPLCHPGSETPCKVQKNGLPILCPIIQSQESVQEPSGSWRLCFLPRTHAGHRKEYGRTKGPWVTASGGSWCRVAAREIAPVSRCSLWLARDPPRRMLSRSPEASFRPAQ